MRKALYGLIAFFVVILGFAVAAPFLIDVNDYKPQIVAKAKEATGRDLTIDGKIRLSLLPSPELTVDGVKFANIPGSQEPQMAQLRSLRVSVSLLPLLSGRAEVTQVVLVGPRIVLETTADGRANWDIAGADRPASAAPAGGAGTPSGDGGGRFAIDVRDLTIEDGTLIVRDGRSGQTRQFDKINGHASLGSLQGPLAAELQLTSRGLPIQVDLRVAAIGKSGGPVALTVRNTGGQLRLDGVVSSIGPDAKFDGTVKASGDNLATLLSALAALAGDPPAGLPPVLAQKFDLQAGISANADGGALSSLKISLGEDSGSGELKIQLKPLLRVDAKLAFARLDFDRLLASARPQAAPSGSPPAGSAPQPPAAAPLPGTAGQPMVPKDLEGSLDISVGTISYQGKLAQQIAVKGDVTRGVLTIKEAGGLFPGATSVKLAGVIDTGATQPRVTGEFDLRSARLRELLTWLNIDVARLPPERLNNFSFTGKLAATPEGNAQVSDAVVKLDATTARGSLTVQTKPRLTLLATIDLDALNLDAYLPPPAAAGGGPTAPGTAAPAPAGGGVGALPDLTLKAKVGRLTYQGNQIEGVDVDVTYAPNKLTFRNSKIANLAGGGLAWSGTLADFNRPTPLVDMNVDLRTQDFERMLALVGAKPPLPGQRIGALTAMGHIATRGSDYTFQNFAVGALGSSVKLTGTLALPAAGPQYNFSRLEFRTDDLERMLKIMGAQSPLEGQRIGAVTMAGSAQGNLEQVKLDVDIAALGTSIDVKGTIAGLRTTQTVNIDVAVEHPDFHRFMQIVSPGYRGGVGVGPFKMQSHVAGQPAREIKLTNLRGNIGPSTFSGGATINYGGAVPVVVATLDTSPLDLNRILPLGARADLMLEPPPAWAPKILPASFGGDPQLAQVVPRGGTGGGRFAREPFNVSALHAVQANLTVRSAALQMAPWRVDNAVAQLDMRNGVINVSRLTGNAFGGEFSLTGVLTATRLPANFSARLSVRGLDMRRLSFALHQKDRFDGTMNIEIDLNAVGSSEADLIANLNGTGNVRGSMKVNTSAREQVLGNLAGVVQGLGGDVGRTVGKVTGGILGGGGAPGADLSEAIRIGLQRFADRLGPVSGDVQIRNGVATTNNLVWQGNRAQALTRMTANLPGWGLDAVTNILLEENPNVPYLIITHRGSLDSPNRTIQRNPNYAGPGGQQQQPQRQQQQSPLKSVPNPLDIFKRR